MLTSIAFVIAALAMVWAAYARGRKDGHAAGMLEGQRDGWTAHAALITECRAQGLERAEPKPGSTIHVLLPDGDSYEKRAPARPRKGAH